MLPVYYTGLCTGHSKKEATGKVLSQSTLTESHVKKLVAIFQSDVTKFDRKRYCTLFLRYAGLCARYSMKEAISLSVKRSKEYHEKAVYVNFQFSNLKLSQER